MVAERIDGRAIAAKLQRQLQRDIGALVGPRERRPLLKAVVIGQTKAATLFYHAQRTLAHALGLGYEVLLLDSTAATAEVEAAIRRLNSDPAVDGIFVLNPVPPQVDPQRVSAAIDPAKDVEGIHPQNSARRFFAKARIGSCTALAVMELIESTGVELYGREAVVVGNSEIVGRPVGMLLLDRMATTTVCHIATDERGALADHVRRAEILVVAVGQPGLIKGDWIRPGAVVIDVGINPKDGGVVGDVEFEGAARRAGFITPVPGGVGPVTVTMVMRNLIEAYRLGRTVHRELAHGGS